MLREVAQRIDAEMRISDTGARFGGDEFAIVLAQAGDGGRREGRGARAARRAPHPIPISKDAAETVTLSIGVAAAAPAPERATTRCSPSG